MGMIWDEQKHADLTAEAAKKRGLLADLSLRMNDAHASDKPWDEQRLARYTADGVRHKQLTSEIALIESDRRELVLLEPRAVQRSEASVFVRWLRKGENGIEADERPLLVPAEGRTASGPGIVLRASGPLRPTMATASDAASGQETVQETVLPTIVDRLSYYGGVARAAYSFTTSAGNEYRIPQADSASQTGVIQGAQGQPVPELDLPTISPAGSQVTFYARNSNSRWIKLTREMLVDPVLDIESYAQRIALRRLGRVWNAALTTTQVGAGMPVGIVSAAAAGVTAASATGFTWLELVELEYDVNRAYRSREDGEEGEGGLKPMMGGMVGWMVSDSAEKALKRLADDDQRPLWLPSIRDGKPNMLGGYPIVVNGDMATVETGNVPVLFGNFGYYGVRTVSDIEFFRFMDSNTMENQEVWCIAYARRDGRPYGALTAATTSEAWSKLTMA